MARFTFKLPDIGEGIAEAEIVAWHVAVGDRVEEDQNISTAILPSYTSTVVCAPSPLNFSNMTPHLAHVFCSYPRNQDTVHSPFEAVQNRMALARTMPTVLPGLHTLALLLGLENVSNNCQPLFAALR